MIRVAVAVAVVSTFGTPFGGIIFSIEMTATYYIESWQSLEDILLCYIHLNNLQDVPLPAIRHFCFS
jgi:H+/Cl- antiporter ClcA